MTINAYIIVKWVFMEHMEYSFKDIENIKASIEIALKEDLNKTERVAFLKNLKMCKSKLKELSEILLDDYEGFDEFAQKRFDIFVDEGAKIESLPNGTQTISDLSEVNKEKLEERLLELQEEYSEVLEGQQEIIKENEKTKKERKVEVEWFTFDFNDLSNEVDEKVLNENTLDFINA